MSSWQGIWQARKAKRSRNRSARGHIIEGNDHECEAAPLFGGALWIPVTLSDDLENLNQTCQYLFLFNSQNTPERRLLQVQTCRTYSEGHPQVLLVVRRPQSVHRPYALIRTRSLLWNVTNCRPVRRPSLAGCSERNELERTLSGTGRAPWERRTGQPERLSWGN